jgi:hypothetical protein
MSLSLTGANAVLTLSISGLFDVPQQIQGFAADDVTETEPVTPAEVYSGVDGNLSGGWVYVPRIQTIMLQADSLSNILFEDWNAAQEAIQDLYFAGAELRLPSLGRAYVFTKGILSHFLPTPAIKKIAQPRRYQITWQKCIPMPV